MFTICCASVMATVLPRPTKPAIAEIHSTFIEHDLHPRARVRLRAILAWAEGKTTREAAAASKPKLSDGTVRTAVQLYRTKGITPFLTDMAVRRRSQSGAAKTKEAAVIDAMKNGIAAGRPPTSRALAQQVELSLGTVAAIAKKYGLSGSARRGPMPFESPPGGGQGDQREQQA